MLCRQRLTFFFLFVDPIRCGSIYKNRLSLFLFLFLFRYLLLFHYHSDSSFNRRSCHGSEDFVAAAGFCGGVGGAGNVAGEMCEFQNGTTLRFRSFVRNSHILRDRDQLAISSRDWLCDEELFWRARETRTGTTTVLLRGGRSMRGVSLHRPPETLTFPVEAGLHLLPLHLKGF